MAFTIPGLNKYPKEAEIIGRLLAGYGELEYAMTQLLKEVLGDIDVAVKVLFRSRGEEGRIAVADALMRHKFVGTPLYQPYQHAISDMQHCKTIRNQFAHCIFDGLSDNGLRFVDLETSAKSTTSTTVNRVPVSLDLLQAQENFFGYVEWRFFWLTKEFERREGRGATPDVQMPQAVPRPPLNSLPPKHTSPTLDQ